MFAYLIFINFKNNLYILFLTDKIKKHKKYYQQGQLLTLGYLFADNYTFTIDCSVI